jgi:hypothetical protein
MKLVFVTFATAAAVCASLVLDAPRPRPVILFSTMNEGWGNACLVQPDTAITAYHVAEIANSWVAETGMGHMTIVKRWGKRDIVTVRLEGGPLLPFSKIAKDLPKSGDPITIVTGMGSNAIPVVFRGWYVAKNGSGGFLQIDVPIYPGMSGSCVLNQAGEAIGIAVGLGHNKDIRFQSLAIAEDITGEKP